MGSQGNDADSNNLGNFSDVIFWEKIGRYFNSLHEEINDFSDEA